MAWRVERFGDGAVELRSWPRWAAKVLDELPALADPDVPAGPARDRLYQRGATDDPVEAAEWRARVHPELHALFAAARDLVAGDLAAAQRTPLGGLRRCRIPAAHVAAWVAALNTARLRIAASHGIDAAAMAADPDDAPVPQREALLRIDVFTMLQEGLLDAPD